MSASEYQEWKLYYASEPFGAWRDNLHAGIIASVVANAFRKASARALTPQDFILMTSEERRQTSLARGLSALRALAKRGRKP